MIFGAIEEGFKKCFYITSIVSYTYQRKQVFLYKLHNTVRCKPNYLFVQRVIKISLKTF